MNVAISRCDEIITGLENGLYRLSQESRDRKSGTDIYMAPETIQRYFDCLLAIDYQHVMIDLFKSIQKKNQFAGSKDFLVIATISESEYRLLIAMPELKGRIRLLGYLPECITNQVKDSGWALQNENSIEKQSKDSKKSTMPGAPDPHLIELRIGAILAIGITAFCLIGNFIIK